MGADVLATQGARASAAMIFTMFNRMNLVPACYVPRLLMPCLFIALHPQAISSHNVDSITKTGPCLPFGTFDWRLTSNYKGLMSSVAMVKISLLFFVIDDYSVDFDTSITEEEMEKSLRDVVPSESYRKKLKRQPSQSELTYSSDEHSQSFNTEGQFPPMPANMGEYIDGFMQKRDVTPLLTYWSFISFALSHWYGAGLLQNCVLDDSCCDGIRYGTTSLVAQQREERTCFAWYSHLKNPSGMYHVIVFASFVWHRFLKNRFL